MKKRYFTLPSLLFIIQLISVLPLRAEHYYFKQISLKEGLPSNVRCILRDEQGFVWIGTKSGLGKFDGHELKKIQTPGKRPELASPQPDLSDCRRQATQHLGTD